ncbi:TonB-dependent receptor [Nonlabens ulvanivorans]|nr:TonB-dependent receptor [Nonlabens ulvanivorans]
MKLHQITDKYDITANAGYRDFGNYEDGDGTEILRPSEVWIMACD